MAGVDGDHVHNFGNNMGCSAYKAEEEEEARVHTYVVYSFLWLYANKDIINHSSRDILSQFKFSRALYYPIMYS